MTFKIPFFGTIETIPQAINILKTCSLIFIAAGILESLIGLVFMRHILFTGILNLIFGILLYFIQIYSLGLTIFLWSLVAPMGSFTSGWGINFQESSYAVFTLVLAATGAVIFWVSIKLNKLRYPPDDGGDETKLSD